MMKQVMVSEKTRELGQDINENYDKADNYFISRGVKKEIPNSVFPFIKLVRNHNSLQFF